ncbi:MAG TPA: extracellular solute-binding protein [Mycobacteriales bacterium]
MRSSFRVGTLAIAAALVTSGAAACGGGDGDGGGGEGQASSIKVWTIEDVADRVAAQKRMAAAFTQKTGIKAEIIAVAEDQFDQTITSAAAANTLPDVIAALPLAQVRSLSSNDLLNTEIAGEVVDKLGKDTFAPRSLELTKDGDKQLAVPSDGWAQLLVYRKDLFDAAGLQAPTTFEAIETAARTLNKEGTAGITLATTPGDGFTQQSFEYLALANGCELVGSDKKVTLDSPACVRTFDLYSKLAKNYSVRGNQDVDSTRATYFAGKAAMLIWSSFILDELAGLRNDALPTCAQCRSDKAWLAKNSGVVTAVKGPDAQRPASYGEVVSFAATSSAPKDAASKFIEFMMSDSYDQWIAIAPEGKVPVRQGTKSGDTSYLQSWEKAKAGVDTKAPLSQYYSPEVLKQVQEAPETFSRWGLTQGQGALVGATLGPLPVPKALADLIAGKGDATSAAQAAQKAVEEIQKGIN